MKLAGALIPLLFLHAAHASGPLRACAAQKGLSIGGIGLVDNRASAIAKLGQPKRIGSYRGEDDGGVYTGSVLVYSQLEINVDASRGIERIASLGPGATLPYGLKQGMSVQQTADTLHFMPEGVDGDGAAVLPVCQSDSDAEVRLHFKRGALESVEIIEAGP